MTKEVLIAMRASAAQDIATAYPESAWNALLAGDLDAALMANRCHIDTRTGATLSPAQAERVFSARASAVNKPKTMGDVTASFWHNYDAKHGRVRVKANPVDVQISAGQDNASRQTLRRILSGRA